jgi:hypothetical protein
VVVNKVVTWSPFSYQELEETPEFKTKAELKKYLFLKGEQDNNNVYEYFGDYNLHFENFQDLCKFLDSEPI